MSARSRFQGKVFFALLRLLLSPKKEVCKKNPLPKDISRRVEDAPGKKDRAKNVFFFSHFTTDSFPPTYRVSSTQKSNLHLSFPFSNLDFAC